MDSLTLWVWLSEKCSPDTPTFSILYHAFSSVESIYSATEIDYKNVPGLKNTQIKALCNKNTDPAEKIISVCLLKNINILPYNHNYYPSRLRTIKNPPVLLYCKGQLYDLNNEVSIATVGTRTPSDYGCRCAYEVVFDLALSGACIISGMAYGIDSVCHKAALDAGGKTIAVLGCGADVIYPKENADLYKNIEKNGAIISEYPPGFKATKYTFPQRNRLISGISLGTLIVESRLKSGAMITARLALEQSRDLFAIPGRLGEYNSLGPNSLLTSGAKAVKDANDILSEYEFLYPDKIRINTKPDIKKNNPYMNTFRQAEIITKKENDNISFSESDFIEKKEFPDEDGHRNNEGPSISFDDLPSEQKNICLCLSNSEPKTLEEIAQKTNESVSEIMSSLTILEIQGIVKAVPGGSYVLS